VNPATAALLLGALAMSAGAPDMPRTTSAPPEGVGRRRQHDPEPKTDGAIPAKTLRRREKKAAAYREVSRG
jgi:hypothetical protein